MAAHFFSSKKYLCLILTAAILLLCHGGMAAAAESEPDSPIHVTSDRLESVYPMEWVDFIGHVTATQADVVITADRMRVFFKRSSESAVEEGAISKIISEGNVKIVFDHQTKTAEADRAVYLAEQQVLELNGEDAKVWSGKNIVRGKKITVFYAEKRSVVEGAGQEQVEATLFVKEGSGLIE